MSAGVQDLIKILDSDAIDKSDAVIVLMGQMDKDEAIKLIWDTGVWNATHPRKGSTANMRVLDIVFRHYTE